MQFHLRSDDDKLAGDTYWRAWKGEYISALARYLTTRQLLEMPTYLYARLPPHYTPALERWCAEYFSFFEVAKLVAGADNTP